MDKVEEQFESQIINPELDIRDTVNEAYQSITKTMFDCLLAIARDSTSQQPSSTTEDEEKEQLNSNISIIENMHYYRETVDDRGLSVLANFKNRAQTLYDEHLHLYIKAVIRRPLGKLSVHSFLLRCDNRTFYKVLRHLYNPIHQKTSPPVFPSPNPPSEKSYLIMTLKRCAKELIYSISAWISILAMSLMREKSLIMQKLQ